MKEQGALPNPHSFPFSSYPEPLVIYLKLYFSRQST
jgi:hypothetical protein